MKYPSRRFGPGWPGKKRLHRGTLVQAFDSSGSVGDTEMAIMVSKGKQVAKRYGAPYLALVCDAQVHTVKMIRRVVDLDEIEVLGGGGTSSLPVFKYLEDNKVRADLMMYFTDLEIDFPPEKPKEVAQMIWVVVNNPRRTEVPFGDVINVEIKET
jgi:predicted metal-dependent peptidase